MNANALGIDLGAIDNRVNQIKTAEYNLKKQKDRDIALQNEAQRKQQVTNQMRDRRFGNDPTAQNMNMEELKDYQTFLDKADEKQKAESARINEENTKTAIAISEYPPEQQQELLEKWKSTLPPDRLEGVKDMSVQDLPLLITAGLKMDDMYKAHTKKELERVKQNNALALQEVKGSQQEKLQGIKGSQALKLESVKSKNKLALEKIKAKRAIAKEAKKASKKAGVGGVKSADENLMYKAVAQNLTGLDLSNPDSAMTFMSLDKGKRDDVVNISAKASKIYERGEASTRLEAVQKAISGGNSLKPQQETETKSKETKSKKKLTIEEVISKYG